VTEEADSEASGEESNNDDAEEESTENPDEEVVIEAGDSDSSEEETDEEAEITVVQTAVYSMITDSSLGLSIDINLQHLSNGEVRIDCSVEDTESDTQSNTGDSDTEGSAEEGEAGQRLKDYSAILPSTIYLIDDGIACGDMGAAIARGDTVQGLSLAEVTQLGEEETSLEVSWEDIRQARCLVLLKESPQTNSNDENSNDENDPSMENLSEEESMDGLEDNPSQSTGNGRDGQRILRTAGLSRVFGSISLASFSLVSLGFTGAFSTVVGGSYVVHHASTPPKRQITFWSANGAIITVALGIIGFAGFYYVSRRPLFRRRFSQISQRLADISFANRARIVARIDAFEDGMADVIERMGGRRNTNIFSRLIGSYRNLYRNWVSTITRRKSRDVRRIDDWVREHPRYSPKTHQEPSYEAQADSLEW